VKSYRQALQQVLSRRLSVNPRYSLRAFARDLKISPSFLSQVLGGKRGLTLAKATDIFCTLEFSPTEKKLLMLEIQKEQKRSDKKKAVVQKQIDTAVQLTGAYTFETDEFDRLSQWYVIAILQLLRMKDAPRKNKDQFCGWAAAKLGINIELVDTTLGELMGRKMISKEKAGLTAIHDTVWTSNQVPSGAIRSFHKQMIDKAKTAIEMQSVNDRFLQSIQFPVLKTSLPEIQSDILKFRNQMLRKHGRTATEDADTVYGLNLQLFRLLEE
jgi:uncharacterized protein (TIGR02147 family)